MRPTWHDDAMSWWIPTIGSWRPNWNAAGKRNWWRNARACEEADRITHRPAFPQLSAQMRHQLEPIGQALPALWTSGQISNEHKKRLLRSLITRIMVTRQAADHIELKIVWVRGHFS